MNPTNYLIIICDQLSATALSAYGNTYSRTPNLDRLAERSAIYEYAYTPCPLCQPARASFWTSRYPHETMVRTNLPKQRLPFYQGDDQTQIPSHLFPIRFQLWESFFLTPVIGVFTSEKLMTTVH